MCARNNKRYTKIFQVNPIDNPLTLIYQITPAGQGGPKGYCVQQSRSNHAILHKSCPKSEIVTCVMFSTHTNTSLIKPHLIELDEIHRNRPKSNYNLAKNLQSWSVTSDIRHQTSDTQTEIHTFFIWYPRVGREHNSPSGKNIKNDLEKMDLQVDVQFYRESVFRTPESI